jgi:hypothetical protein
MTGVGGKPIFVAPLLVPSNGHLRRPHCALPAIVLAAALAMNLRFRSAGGESPVDREDAAGTVRSIVAC